MKLVIDERVKHRLTGLIVILSIIAIFLPAVVKKSNQRFEENVSFSVRMPAKPILPDVAVADEKEVFKSVKVARVDIHPVVDIKPTEIAKAEPLSIKSILPAAPVTASSLAEADIKKKPIVTKMSKKILVPKSNKNTTVAKVQTLIPPAVKAAGVPKKLAKAAVLGVKKEVYAVQLASFSQRDNALSLVEKLRNKGFKATYNTANSKQGLYYKVVVGQLNQRHEAIHLQKQLASSMQLNGFIIKTGAS